jgi:hypothetical protein
MGEILTHLRLAGPGCSILDPCAGRGDAVLQLGAGLGLQPDHLWTVELDGGRSAELAQRGTNHLWAAAQHVGCTAGAFSLLYLNPPYDDEIGGGQRTELAFLIRCTYLLRTQGVLCLVIPQRVLDRDWDDSLQRYLLQHYRDVAVLEPKERPYDEIVVFGVRRSGVLSADASKGLTWTSIPPKQDGEPVGPVYLVPEAPGPKVWKQTAPSEEEILELLKRSPLQRQFAEPEPQTFARPPLPLSVGHRALLLAGGMLDGRVAPPGEPPHVVRGTARKERYISSETHEESEDGKTTSKTVWSERIELVIRVATPEGRIITVGKPDKPEGGADGS